MKMREYKRNSIKIKVIIGSTMHAATIVRARLDSPTSTAISKGAFSIVPKSKRGAMGKAS